MFWVRRSKKPYIELFKKQSLKRNGYITKDIVTSKPALFFKYDNFDIQLRLDYKRDVGKFSAAKVDLKSRGDIVIEVNMPLFGMAHGIPMMGNIKFANPNFDNSFRIRGNDINFIKSLFSLGIQKKMLEFGAYEEEMTNVFRKQELRIMNIFIHKGKLSLQFEAWPNTEEECDRMLDFLFMLCDSYKSLTGN